MIGTLPLVPEEELEVVPPANGCCLNDDCLSCPFPDCQAPEPEDRSQRIMEYLRLYPEVSYREVSTLFGVSYQRVSQLAHQGKIKHYLPKRPDERIRQRYLNGMTVPELVELYKVSKTTICRICKGLKGGGA